MEIGAAACFGDCASEVGLGLGEGAGGGGGVGEEEVEGALEALVEDACNFASRFMRIWGSVSQGCRPMDIRGDAKAYTVGITGRIGQRLARTHDRNSFLAQIRSDGGVRSFLGSLPDGRLADGRGGQLGRRQFQSTLYNQPVHDMRRGLTCWLAKRTAATRRQHVFFRFLLYGTSVHRAITSSLLHFSNTWVSEAQNSLWHKKEVARISLRRVQACQRHSIRSPCQVVTCFLLLPTHRHIPVIPT